MRWWFAGCSLSVIACGGSVGSSPYSDGPPPGGGSGGASTGGAGGVVLDGGSPVSGGAGGATGGSSGAGGVFVDPGCPDPGPPVPGPRECDPFDPLPACGPFDRCVPYVEYADDCGTEVFGTECAPAGTGVQGDDCTRELCAAQHTCVTSGEGLVCARLCRRDGTSDDCPPGLLCTSLDVDGFDICY